MLKHGVLYVVYRQSLQIRAIFSVLSKIRTVYRGLVRKSRRTDLTQHRILSAAFGCLLKVVYLHRQRSAGSVVDH